jgi:hypothetical protein
MPTERTTIRDDDRPDRVVERQTFVDRGGGVGGVIVGIAVLALVAIVAFFLLNANRNDAIRTNATTSAAQSVADSANNAANAANDAAQNVGNAANSAANSAASAADSAASSASNAADNATPAAPR